MYRAIKTIFKAIVPRRFLVKNELIFRRAYALFYSGSAHQCNICDKKLRTFVIINDQDLLCPNCGSLSRHRRLWKILFENNAIQGKVMHFSPSRSLYRKLSKSKTITYVSTDYADEFIADFKFDITNINQKENSFDTIIAYHILEHVMDDKKAIEELFRVLKPGGKVFIQTPFKTEDIYEDETLRTPEERKEHFGQEDHFRIYSINGLKIRLESTGFKVKITTFSTEDYDTYWGYKSPETVLIASK